MIYLIYFVPLNDFSVKPLCIYECVNLRLPRVKPLSVIMV